MATYQTHKSTADGKRQTLTRKDARRAKYGHAHAIAGRRAR